MVNYRCSRCDYNTDHKSKFRLHLLKKNTCPSKFNETSIYDILKLYGFDEEATEYEITHNVNKNNQHKLTKINKNNQHKLTKINKNNQHKLTKINKNSTENKISAICKFCSKKLSCYKSCNRHEKTCKEKNNIEEQSNDSLNDKNDLQKNYDALVIQVEKLMNEVAVLKTKNTSKISNKITNKTNNINNGIVNNIVINNYGSENIDYITFNRFVKLLETPLSAISKLIELKHFNGKHPENHNIKITNIHDKFAKIYKDKKWLVSNKKDIIQDLVENGYADFEEFKDLNEEELTNKIKERYKKMEKYYTDNFGELYKQSEMSIINGTNKLE